MDYSDARKKYGDIIDLPHHQSVTRAHMPLKDRAAQFAPFAALSGFDEIIREETRYTDSEKTIEENELEILDRKLGLLSQRLHEGVSPAASFVCFVPDTRKEGGSYVTIRGCVKKIDELSGKILLSEDAEAPEKLKRTIDIEISRLVSVELDEDL